MLSNERYRGVLVWGRTGAEYAGRTRKTVERDESQVVRVEREDLRIVSDELTEAALAALLGFQRFFARHAAINSFTQLVVRSEQRQEKWKVWEPLAGALAVL